MQKIIHVYNVYVSYADDVSAEVDQFKKETHRISKSTKLSNNTEIALTEWKDIPPGISDTEPQAKISKFMMDSQINLGVCFFWTRFGTPTAEYGSGMEEEIEVFLKKKKDGELDDLWVFFKVAPPLSLSTKNFDYAQFYRLQEYKRSRINSMRNPSILYAEYSKFAEISAKLDSWYNDCTKKHALNAAYAHLK